MSDEIATGWDVGGAHLKVAQIDGAGHLRTAIQIPCTLWRGMEHLADAMARLQPQLSASRLHGVTMTGELVDLFGDRTEGVNRLIDAMTAGQPGATLKFYAGELGFLGRVEAKTRTREIASANWHATAKFAAGCCGTGVLVDVGSTTSDIVPLSDGHVCAVGYTDAERMVAEELVYTGVTRTPVMVLADSVPFAGQRQRLMAEYFATAADVHRLTGELPEDADQHPTADGRGKTPTESARRLARMLGRDFESGGMTDWRRLARYLSECQCRLLQQSIDRTLSRGSIGEDAPLIGAGVGRFLVARLAARLGRPYRDFIDLVSGEPAVREWAARAAPAAAVAALVSRL
ncbi:MAG: (((gamma-L-glutamylamino)ethyl phenoxymethyl)furan-2-yl)methanamine synthase [Rhodospirillaceae bacterium]|nr:(((gamma-L-glutamylamino)ethyl phenoxymethyl)furan-2-yl)methanamine synthase [Rhodospirillaceae bacterium]